MENRSSYGFGPPVRNGRKPVELEIRDQVGQRLIIAGDRHADGLARKESE
jgi:hypothetical protein